MLNPSQQQAIETAGGPLRIVAGAGTGKTRTLTERIAYLIETENILPHRILALTFTNKAAHEMVERLRQKREILKQVQDDNALLAPQVMTFHSLAARLLRQYWDPNFIILTEKDGGPPEDVNALDFDGLLTKLIEVWDEKPEVLMDCQQKFDHILVDEYQDVNAAQIEIVRRLAEPHRNLCVVGDPDQTIYSWRGAKATSMTEFAELYPETKTVILTQNYRNPPAILKGAEELIRHNPDRIEKRLEAAKTTGQPIALWENGNEWEGYDTISHILEMHLGSHGDMVLADSLDVGRHGGFRPFSDIAILYRTQAEGKKIAARLAERGYPCQMSASESFWERKEVKEFLGELEKFRSGICHPELVSGSAAAPLFSSWLRDRITSFAASKQLKAAPANHLNLLIAYAIPFDRLPVQEALAIFLDETKLQQEADNLIMADRINLLTLHAAKGLEFPVVVIIGLEEEHIPHLKPTDDPDNLAEERRLLYVGMTRATEELHLLGAKKTGNKELKPSRFLAEIGHANMATGQLPEKAAIRLKRKAIKQAQMKMF
ncbi:UvrD-helicase domain-containing protein [Candidatus Peregrinibacteria bacterium]|nr:UvrD-helicase domain-containing protein [Candidatus Peregrinibacteria bacterium]